VSLHLVFFLSLERILIQKSILFVGVAVGLAACTTYEPDRNIAAVNETLTARGGADIARQDIDTDSIAPLEGRITMDAAARDALRYNAELQAGLEDLNLADARRVQEGLILNPNVVGEFIVEEAGEPLSLNLGIGLDLSRIFTRGWRMRTATAEQDAVQAEVTAMIMSKIMEARLGVFDLWASQMAMTIARDIVITRRAAVAVADELSRVGNLETGRLARARALLARAELDAALTELALLDARLALADITGRPLGMDIEADIGALPDGPADKAEFVRASLDASFMLEAARARLRASGERLGLAKVEVWLSHIETGAVFERDGEWGEGFEVGLPLPIFDMGGVRSGAARAPGLKANCWGYNGGVHGPTIEAVEGDIVRIYVTNKLPAPTTVHWHGIILPSGMDGVGGLSQRPIDMGETYLYEFRLNQHGTFMYHSHHDEMTQMAMGLMGMFVIHPRVPKAPAPDRDYVLMLSEWSIRPGTERPDPNEMTDFNILTMNGQCFPGTQPLMAFKDDAVRVRLGNLSAMDHHPVHLHGHAFTVTETDGGPIPPSAQHPDTTVLVPTGATRTVDFVADNPGDWAFHCHMTHHVMNQMGHDLDLVIGADGKALQKAISSAIRGHMMMGHDGMGDHGQHIEMGFMDVPDNSISMVGGKGPRGYITMGGMFTLLKVREKDQGLDPDSWWQNPRGTGARRAFADELKRDGIVVDG